MSTLTLYWPRARHGSLDPFGGSVTESASETTNRASAGRRRELPDL